MANIAEEFPALRVEKLADGTTTAVFGVAKLDELPPGNVIIEVAYSSLNYKDALACRGHPGVVRTFPHVPGIDAAGLIVQSAVAKFSVGQAVLVTGYGLGSDVWGGFARYVRVPSEWVVPMPDGLDVRSAMTLGTAGFTAAQCVSAIVERQITPDDGEVVVTGATGGVGIWSVAILAKLGYQVTAISGKPEQAELLREVGASRVEGRELVSDDSVRPLLPAKWAAAIDTVGGAPLATILRSTKHRGCVAACGLVAGVELPLTVHPFILRGVTLAGIDSAKCPYDARLEVWRKLAGEWRVDLPASCVTETSLENAPQRVDAMLDGKLVGRTLVIP
ncbi:MAG: YhdH/YhfP family quinone oxidoreductase [Aeoliella sp.]